MEFQFLPAMLDQFDLINEDGTETHCDNKDLAQPLKWKAKMMRHTPSLFLSALVMLQGLVHAEPAWVFEYEEVWPDLGDTTNDVAAADIDGDGRTDIVSDKYLYWFRNPGRRGTVWERTAISGDSGADWWLGHWTGDFDGDGDQDVVSGNCADTRVYWFENVQGDGSRWNRHTLPIRGVRGLSGKSVTAVPEFVYLIWIVTGIWTSA